MTVRASESYPAVSWRGSDLFGPVTAKPLAPESTTEAHRGPRRHCGCSPGTTRRLRWLRSGTRSSKHRSRSTSPRRRSRSCARQHYLTLGGLDFMLYRLARRDDERGRGGQLSASPAPPALRRPDDRGAFFAVRRTSTPGPRRGPSPRMRGQPPRGERSSHGREAALRRRKTLDVDDAFLERKVPRS